MAHAFVGDRQPLASLGAAALQHDPAVLRRHADPEPVRLGATAGVRLVCTLALHGVLYANDGRRRCPGEIPILVGAQTGSSNRQSQSVTCGDGVLQSQVPDAACTDGTDGRPFGFFPKISTTVENTVEKPDLLPATPKRHAISGLFYAAAAAPSAVFSGLRGTCDRQITAGARVRTGESRRFIDLFWRRIRHGRQHLGPDPHPDRNQGQPAQLLHLVQADVLRRRRRSRRSPSGCPIALFKDWLTKHYSVVLAEALAEVERPEASTRLRGRGRALPPDVAAAASAADGRAGRGGGRHRATAPAA